MPDREVHLKKIHRFIENMPSLSTTVGKVMEICSRQDASPNELIKVISLDPVLTGQVLKLINSAYYSLVNKVTSLARAIIMLGINTVKNLVLATAIIQSIKKTEKSKVLPTHDFWAHSIGVGVLAKLIATNKGVPIDKLEEYFVAGLLHDLGKIPFDNDYINVLRRAKNGMTELIGVEKLLLGIDHSEVGDLIAKKWQLNHKLTDAIVHHHTIDLVHEENIEFVAIIDISDCYINLFDIGYAGNPFPDEKRFQESLHNADLEWEDINQLTGLVHDEIEKAKIFLQI